MTISDEQAVAKILRRFEDDVPSVKQSLRPDEDRLLIRYISALRAIPRGGVKVKVTEEDAVHELYLDALAEAEKAMRKFPQPNYVISKVAEEAGEVVKAAIHCAEGRETHKKLVGEIRQAMAMLIRLYVEGDQVHGLSSPRAALSQEGE